ncbi:XK-related protein 8 [Pseudophryne corroboree]|uniref:XK-related protein 8 n=1 Tax=Pseudophryne corroboree TaxID=495146 RepID=UPI00308200DD
MPGCLPPRYRLLDLLLALVGTFAFLGDLCADVWSALRYYQAGNPLWAALHLGLFLLSSAVLQLLSWGWFWADRADWTRHDEDVPVSEIRSNGTRHQEDSTVPSATESASSAGGCCTDGALAAGNLAGGFPEDMTPASAGHSPHAAALPAATSNGETVPVQPGACNPAPGDPGTEKWVCCQPGVDAEYEHFMGHFQTSKVILRPSCLLVPHILQLGYLLRCIHSLEVGIAAYRNPKSSQYQDYAYFLTHDISMMRLVETFLENTPQLILVLYIIIQQEMVHTFQYVSISISFICTSWAILDYHQSLRLFLQDKNKLGTFSSIIFFLWNFCLISARILCITLFTVVFRWQIGLHFLTLWLAFFIWANLQQTDFMKSHILEFLYRATVAVILYFSWFNIADGRTIYRCILYYIFITTDSMLLILSWKFLKYPSILEEYEMPLLMTVVLCFITGLLLRWMYYKLVHPNVYRETKQQYDEPDSITGEGPYRMFVAAVKTERQNNRMFYLAKQLC